MDMLRSVLLVLVWACSISTAVGRVLQQERPQIVKELPVQIGDGSERVLTKSYMSARGGAVKALGRSVLVDLRKTARLRGTVRDLARLIESDEDLGVDAVNKALVYQCKSLAIAAVAATAEIESGVAPSALDTSIDTAKAFSLSSRPSATKKIYLDFNGHNTTNTDWNRLVSREPIVSPAFDKDGLPDNWSTQELNDIVFIWRAVAEDYAMFDVDVTTADPGAAVMSSGNALRVVIGGSSSDWYGSPAGGVAYIGKFNVPDLPVFVFPQQLGPNNAKIMGDAISHEVGHALGLAHDGTPNSVYFAGQDKWAPIMGTAYYMQISTFDKGEFAGAVNTQDDLAVINGFLPLIPQEYGSDAASATPLNGTVDASTGIATAKVSGVVATSAGDWFRFAAVAGTATLSAAVVAPMAGSARANLVPQLTVYDAENHVIATISAPATDAVTGLNVPPTAVNLPAAGIYFVAVTGVAALGMPSSYGSRGQYVLTAVYTPCTDCSSMVPVSSPAPPSPSPSPSPAPLAVMRVGSIAMTKSWLSGKIVCSVTVTMRDASGNPLPSVKVNGRWTVVSSGVTSTASTANVLTSSVGTASFRSGSYTAASGTCTFTVMEAARTGFELDPTSAGMSRTISL